MTEIEGSDIESSTARAWRRFQARLADRLVELADGETLLVEAEVGEEELDGAAPYVQFVGYGEGAMLRGEVSSNAYLDERHRLDDSQAARLAEQGWARPTEESPNFHRDVPVEEGDRLAVGAVTVLRDVLGVTHPAFLICEDLETFTPKPLPPRPAREEEPVEPLATIPESHEHLQELVDAALTLLFDERPEKDPDGDIPVPYGSSLVFVRVEPEAPVVHLFSPVVLDVTDRERAAFEVNVLNRDVEFLTFHLSGDRIVARLQLPAWPFVPEHLRTMLAGMSSKLDDLDDDLAVRVGGRVCGDSSEARGGAAPVPAAEPGPSLPTELVALLELDADRQQPVEPELAAAVCHFDLELVVRLLRTCQEQEAAWRQSHEHARTVGDDEEAAVCDGEVTAWRRTTRLLRRALRAVAEREAEELPRSSGRSRRLTPRRAG